MNSKQRLNLLKIIKAMYTDEKTGFNVLTEIDIFNALKSVPNVMLTPNSTKAIMPKTEGVHAVYGPEIIFNFVARIPPKGADWASEENLMGDPKIINAVKTAINSKLIDLITSGGVRIKYLGDNNYTGAVYMKLTA